MSSRFLPSLHQKRSSQKTPKTRYRLLRSELLEPRTMLSGVDYTPLAVESMPPNSVSAIFRTSAIPTLAKSIVINNNATVLGRTAALSVLGKDDGGEARLTYRWTVTAAPSGGRATFNMNGTNAAKYATATFTKIGTYSITVQIVDASGLSVKSTGRVTVAPVLSYINVSTTSGKVATANNVLTIANTKETFVAQGLDQFGYALTATPTYRWLIGNMPEDATTPTVTPSGARATVAFGLAGAYTLVVSAKTSTGTTVSRGVSTSVAQVVSGVRNVAATTSVSGTSLAVQPLFVDQFGKVIGDAPAVTWTTTAKPSSASAPTFSTIDITTTIAFNMAGTYAFRFYATSTPSVSFVTRVNVLQTLTSINVTPYVTTVLPGGTQQFSAQALDQFSRSMANPRFAWTATSGSISNTGLYTSPLAGANATITATSGSVQGTAVVSASSNLLGLQNAALKQLIQIVYVDGSVSRLDMIRILRSTGDDGVVDATELSDLQKIVSASATLNMANYVQVLASDVVNGNVANATYQGRTLGNLTGGSSAAKLNTLVDKWFFGTDHPTLTTNEYVYNWTAGSLFATTPSHRDEYQGMLGDCYLISTLGTIADSNPTAIRNMIIDNGDGTFTVRFYTGSYGYTYNNSDGSYSDGFLGSNVTADYVTVDRMLATNAKGIQVYSNYGYDCTSSSNTLWIALIEKAYAQWNETGREGRNKAAVNTFAAIEGGWMGPVCAQVLGYNANDFDTLSGVSKQATIGALAAGKAVTTGTLAWGNETIYGLYSSHSYAIIGYDANTDKFTLYNPWGSSHPDQLYWNQISYCCSQICIANTSGTSTFSSTRVKATAVRAAVYDQAFGMLSNIPSSESAHWLSTEEPNATPSAHSELLSAATSISSKAVETLASSWSQLHQIHFANLVRGGSHSTSLADATFASDEFLSHGEMWMASHDLAHELGELDEVCAWL